MPHLQKCRWGFSFAHCVAQTESVGRRLAPKAVPYTKADGTVSWRVRFRLNGRQTTETFASEVAANVFVSRMVDPQIGIERAVEMRDREDPAAAGYVPTVEEALRIHVEELTGVEQRTRDDYLAVARRSWLDTFGRRRIDEVEYADVARWTNQATGSPKTVRNALGVLSGVFTTAERKGWTTRGNPARGIRISRAGEEDVEDIHFLTYDQFDLLFPQIPVAHRPLVVHLFGTGHRWSEATALQGGDFDLQAGQTYQGDWVSAPTVKVVRAWKKGMSLGPPKSKRSRRTIVLPSEVVDVVEPILEQPGRASTDVVFQTRTGQPIRHSNFFNRVWKPATIRASICERHWAPGCRCGTAKPESCTVHTKRDAAGHRVLPEPCRCPGTIPFRPRIHDARHTHASWLIAQGARLEVIQERLGHESYLTTRKLYGHLMPDARVEAGLAASMAFSATQALQPVSMPALPAR